MRNGPSACQAPKQRSYGATNCGAHTRLVGNTAMAQGAPARPAPCPGPRRHLLGRGKRGGRERELTVIVMVGNLFTFSPISPPINPHVAHRALWKRDSRNKLWADYCPEPSRESCFSNSCTNQPTRPTRALWKRDHRNSWVADASPPSQERRRAPSRRMDGPRPVCSAATNGPVSCQWCRGGNCSPGVKIPTIDSNFPIRPFVAASGHP